MADLCRAQIEEEKQERTAQLQMLRKSAPPSLSSVRLSSRVALLGGYDSNATLSPNGKGSMFEESLYSLSLNKPFSSETRLSLNYTIDYLNYNEEHDLSNLMNHARLGLHQKLSKFFGVGIGYDFLDLYYPNDPNGDFMFHRGFFYVRHNITPKMFQQFGVESGIKNHTSRKALSALANVFQEKELVDRRHSFAYTIGAAASSKLSLEFKAQFSKNESNAIYLDYYDYLSYEASPSARYQLCEKVSLSARFAYLRKNYTGRVVLPGSKKEKDNVYFLNVGTRYKVDKNSSATLFYTYRDNSTNAPLERYTESVFTLGWEYNF
jgi:hypothetical protein